MRGLFKQAIPPQEKISNCHRNEMKIFDY